VQLLAVGILCRISGHGTADAQLPLLPVWLRVFDDCLSLWMIHTTYSVLFLAL